MKFLALSLIIFDTHATYKRYNVSDGDTIRQTYVSSDPDGDTIRQTYVSSDP
ncbi:21367_t:CDS:2, partial [Rhizophagus irregularis]